MQWKGKQDMLDNCRNTSALFLSTNLNVPRFGTLKVSCTFGARHSIFQTANKPKAGIKSPKQGRARWTPVLTGVCHLKAVTDVYNVDLGKQLRGFCELRQCKPKSCMFLGLLIRK